MSRCLTWAGLTWYPDYYPDFLLRTLLGSVVQNADLRTTFYSIELRKEPGTVVPVIPTLRKLRQGDCYEFETILGYIVSSRG